MSLGEDLIDGWARIARAAGVSKRTAMRRARGGRDPLPAYHYLGRVVAFPSALRDWQARQMHPVCRRDGAR